MDLVGPEAHDKLENRDQRAFFLGPRRKDKQEIVNAAVSDWRYSIVKIFHKKRAERRIQTQEQEDSIALLDPVSPRLAQNNRRVRA